MKVKIFFTTDSISKKLNLLETATLPHNCYFAFTQNSFKMIKIKKRKGSKYSTYNYSKFSLIHIDYKSPYGSSMMLTINNRIF